jgi:hypothetical protein
MIRLIEEFRFGVVPQVYWAVPTGLAILKAAFLNVEIVNLPTGCCDAFSTSFARGTSERRCQEDLRIRHSPVGFPA